MLQISQLSTFFLQSFFESPVPTLLANKNQFLYANKMFLSLFLYSEQDIQNLDFELITPKNVVEISHKAYFDSYELFTHCISERYLLKKDGLVVLTELSFVKHKFDNEEVIIFFVRDISSHKTKNEKLYENEKRLKLALKVSNQAVWDWNNLTGETYYSEDYFTMLGYEPNEFEPSYDKWVELLHPDDRELAIFAQQTYLDSKAESYEIEFRLQRKDLTFIWTHTSAVILTRNSDGVPMRMIGVVMNIDDSKKREIAVKELTQKLIEFAFYNSHVLRSPVSRALGVLQLMRYEESPLYFEMIEKSIIEIDQILVKMNNTLVVKTQNTKEEHIPYKEISIISTDKISQFVYKQLLAKFKTNLKATFYDDIKQFLSKMNVKSTEAIILVIDMQLVGSEIWNQIDQLLLKPQLIAVFLLTDNITVEEIIKARDYSFIKGILLKPFSFDKINQLFS